MKKNISYLLLLLCSLSIVSAQDISKRYMMRTTEHGKLFFILPTKMPLHSSTNCRKGLTFDITYLTDKDSVTINHTLVANTQVNIETVSINYGNKKKYNSPFKILYVQPKSGKWYYRINAIIPYTTLKEAYQSDHSLSIELKLGKDNAIFSYPLKKWSKQQEIMNQIFTVIEAN